MGGWCVVGVEGVHGCVRIGWVGACVRVFLYFLWTESKSLKGFYCLFMHIFVLSLEIQLSRENVVITLIC